MLSAESEVLMRHLPFFERQSVLLFGNITDQFIEKIRPLANSIKLFSHYFNIARQYSNIQFELYCHHHPSIAVYYWTKNKQESLFQLYQWLSQAPIGQKLLIVGENRSGVRSVEQMLSHYGEIYKIDSARRCSLYHFELKRTPSFDINQFWQSYSLSDVDIFALPAVFSARELDQGSALLLSSFKDEIIHGKVLDLGCGAGVIGVTLKKQHPAIDITFSDINIMAIESTKRTLKANQLEGKVVASDVFSNLPQCFDLIVSNPPFHSGIETDYRAVETLINQAKDHLLPNGEFRIVANSFLPYANLLDNAFGSHQTLLQSNKFKVYSTKRSCNNI